MTYQHAPMEEWTPYLAYALRPLRPVVLAGVSARRWLGEWKEPNQACMQWWKVAASVFIGWVRRCAFLRRWPAFFCVNYGFDPQAKFA